MSKKNRDVTDAVLSHSGDFRSDWLRSTGATHMAPLPSHTGLSRTIAQRAVAGARESGAEGVLVVPIDPGLGDTTASESPLSTEALLDLGSRQEDRSGLLLVADNFRGALLLRPGYALVAGTQEFVRGAVPEGTDQAKTEFQRYARKARSGAGTTVLTAVAGEFRPLTKTWKTPRDVPATSHHGHQLELMRQLAAGAVEGPSFARQWLDERRRAMNAGERLGDALTTALDEVFYALEDYSIDPSLRDEDDLTDEELRDQVAHVMTRLDDAERRP
ncbi:colicin immunity domain-containing protein [Streptomyces sp. NPDC058274]|uniref:colicin immunity domain-containing protein n=1 Tax=Streptomyces sp. NPDC058274 TaxID=3346416 RepID=UPI0036E0CD50